MANQNDNDFIDDDLDGDLSSENNAIIDAVEDVREDISDYDDSEEGIFAPAPQKKKSGSSSALLGAVAVVALLGAGGYYVYSQTDLLSDLSGAATELPADVVVAPAVDPAPVDAPVVDQAAVTDLPADPELEAIPQPQPIVNVTEGASAPTSSEVSPVVTADATPAPVDMSAANTASPTPAPVDAPPVEPAAIIPPPPTPAETAAAVVPVVPTPEPAPVAPVPPTPAVVEVAQPASVPEPAQQELTPAVTAQAETPPAVDLSADTGSVSTKRVTKSSAAKPEDQYYDSPGSDALTQIPTPRLDPSRGKTESIIIVEGAKKASTKKPVKTSSESVPYVAAGDGSVEISSSSQEAAIVAAGRALRLGRYDAALDMYSDLYRANPRDGRILMGRAVAMQKLGRNGEAISAYDEVLAVDGDNPDAIVNLMGLVRKERPAVALEKLLDMKQRYPANAAILAQLGVTYADSGNLEDAANVLGSALRIEPQNPQHYFNLGVIAERMKNRPHAIAYYEKALEIDAVYGNGRGINRDMIYDRLARLRG